MLHPWFVIVVAAVLAGCGGTQRAARDDARGTVSRSEVSTSVDLAALREILDTIGSERTLLVLDIDDTLLTSPRFFGSDAWYEWQKTLAPGSPGHVPCPFDMLGISFEAGTQVPTQADAAAIVNSIDADKIMLTARSDVYRSATVRELKRAGFELPGPLKAASRGEVYEWQRDSTAAPFSVSYLDGVFMVAGQDKGVLLLDLLRRLGLSYDRIVLADDGRKNIDAMRNALLPTGIAYHGMLYTRVDKSVDDGDIRAGIEGWAAWEQLLATTYPERLRRLREKACDY